MIVKNKNGFTLIELLIVISIIVLLTAISIFGLTGAREGSRDQRRKTDLETIRSALELYRADCDKYPNTNEISFGGSLTGTNSSGAKCRTTYVYLKTIPSDPMSGQSYKYYQTGGGTSYDLCATQERPGSGNTCGTGGSCLCGGSSSCGSSPCYYKVTNP